jgi:hypothetical protein
METCVICKGHTYSLHQSTVLHFLLDTSSHRRNHILHLQAHNCYCANCYAALHSRHAAALVPTHTNRK